MQDQSSSQGQGSGGINPNLMLGLALMTAGNSKDPQAAIFNALNQMQQAQQYASQQKMQQQQLALNQAQFGIAQKQYGLQENEDKRKADEVQRNLQAGQNISNVIGHAPSESNGWKPMGLIGEKSDMVNNAALYNPGAPKGTVFDVPEKLVQTNIDPVTRAKYEFSRALGESGKVEQAASVFDAATPKPFSLGPGQQQFTPDGKLVAENADKSKIIANEKDLRTQYIADSKAFQDYGDTYGRFTANIQPANGNDPVKDIALMTNYIKLTNPNARINDGQVTNMESLGNIPDAVRSQYNQLIKGGRLTQQSRQQIIDSGKLTYQSQAERQQQLTQQYTDIATRNGFNPQNVIIDYSNKTPDKQNQVRRFNPKTGKIE